VVVEKSSSALLVPDVVTGHVDAAVAYITDVMANRDRRGRGPDRIVVESGGPAVEHRPHQRGTSIWSGGCSGGSPNPRKRSKMPDSISDWKELPEPSVGVRSP
jgi:hypothetical protein